MQISRRENNLATNAGQALGNESRNTFGQLSHALCVLAAGFWIVTLVRPAVIVGKRRDAHPRLPALAARAVEFVRTDIDEAGGVAMVGGVQHDHILATGVRAG